MVACGRSTERGNDVAKSADTLSTTTRAVRRRGELGRRVQEEDKEVRQGRDGDVVNPVERGRCGLDLRWRGWWRVLGLGWGGFAGGEDLLEARAGYWGARVDPDDFVCVPMSQKGSASEGR